ncbi:flagellin [Exilibacterium tricleocarpae]|uniref:Flagellin n=1 Tax=Exilibacterium tricleocarpae TaxID=2591008 RepID=A0A545U3T5_9GAMM|nr:flagellin [Exilibacterium tricleocarpae]TQV84141.1 flagellin [Exilibacterium tricleocarpae]
MPLVINTNVASLNAQRQLVKSGDDMMTAMERLSSGKRINTAADDAAGLAITNRMTSQIRGLNQAIRNASDGISLIQTAEGALDETTNILQRIRELAIQSANGIYNDENRATLDAEVQQLIAELDRISDTTTFNGQKLLDGSLGEVELQVGSNANETIEISIQAMDARTLGMGSTSVDLLGAEVTASLSTLALDDGDILINGQSIGDFTGSIDTFQDLIDNINENVLGVEASGFTSLEGGTVGDGVLENGNTLRITVQSADGSGNNIFNITDTESMDELIEKINTVTGGVVSASRDDSGQLVISNDAGSTVLVTAIDAAGTSSDAAATIVEQATGLDLLDTGGTAQSDTAEGQVVLRSEHNDPITIERGATGTLADLNNLGFRENETAGVVNGVGLVQNSNGANEALLVGELTINDVVIDNDNTDSLIGKIDAINRASDQTGVTANAFAQATLDLTGVLFSTITATRDNVNINGLNIDLAGSTITDSSTLASAINDATDQTGVTARVLGTRLVLESDQGAINIAAASTAANTLVGTTTGLQDITRVFVASGGTFTTSTTTLSSGGTTGVAVQAGLKLSSTNGNPISIELGDNADVARLGLVEANTVAGGSFGTALKSVSVDTAGNAQRALAVVDRALDTINDVRSQLGAVNNRLDFTISNLMNVSENTAAARSRILDADFAAETAQLSRAQVLQQASQAMLAQANAQTQQVLQLLNN